MDVAPTLPPTPRRSRLRIWLRYGLVALAVLAAGLFLARRQIGNLLARKLNEQLAASGVFLDWRSADWVTGPGIRLRGLALYRDSAKRDRLALLGNVTAIKGDSGWSRWDTVNVKIADSTLTLGSGDAETKLERMDMRLRIEPGKVELEECHASLQGLRIEAKGTHVRPAATVPASASAASEPATPGQGLFESVKLDWLQSLKQWARFQPEKDEPVLRVEFRSLPDGRGMDFTAALHGKRFQWRGQTWDSVEAVAKTSIGDKKPPIEIGLLRLEHGGRSCEIEGQFDPGPGILRIGRLESGIDVLAIARALAPEALGSLAGITTAGTWRLSGEGEIPLDRPANSRWQGRVAVDGDFNYAAGGTSVMLQKPSFSLAMKEQAVSVSDFKAGLWSGTLEVPTTQIHLATAEGKAGFETELTLNQARLQSVIDSFGAAQTQPGVVHLTWKGAGGFELASITGAGALSIRDAEFYRIPLLGPLHIVFDQLTPGFGKDVASTLQAGHRLDGGILRIDNLKLESKLTRIEANGTVDLSRQYAHLTAKAKLQGIAGLATWLLSALLELEGEGPVSDVRWKLKNVPGTEMIGNAANAVGKAGEKVIDGAGDAVKGTGKAAKGLLKIPGKLFGK